MDGTNTAVGRVMETRPAISRMCVGEPTAPHQWDFECTNRGARVVVFGMSPARQGRVRGECTISTAACVGTGMVSSFQGS